jgi:flagellar protein FlbD
MIQLTRLNGISIVLNSDLIKTAEASPDTMLTLINGEKIIVRESCDEVTERVLVYRARLLSAVARRLPFNEDLERVVSIASLDVSGQTGHAGLAGQTGQVGQAGALHPMGRSSEPGR